MKDNSLKKWIQLQSSINQMYSHDFKNPIAAISANLSYLEEVLPRNDDDACEALSDSIVATKMLLHMLNNFILISRLENKEHIESVIVPLDSFIKNAHKVCTSMHATVEPTVILIEPLPNDICFWPMPYAKLILENMILTSLQSIQSTGKTTISARIEGENAVITVSDDGISIDPELVAVTFDREFQIDAKMHPHARYGRAMALYGIQLGVAHFGGTVTIETKDDLNIFKLILPLDQNTE